MHTPVEVLSQSDLENAVALLSNFLGKVEKREDFIPN